MDESVVGLIANLIILVIVIGLYGFMMACMWKIFEKAGKPGWAAIVPFYNLLVMTEIVGRPTWWILVFACTCNIGWILFGMDLAERFGKDRQWGLIWIGFLSVVGLYQLGFGAAQYTAPPAGGNA